MNEKELFELWGKSTKYSANSEFKCYFEFFPTVLIAIGLFWCRDSGIVVQKSKFDSEIMFI